MKGARSVATAASLGNMLQGWDNAAVAGALLYLKTEFHLDENPTLEGMVVASTLMGAVASTACAGPSSDAFGRRTMLCVSAFLFVVAGSLMVWSPTIYVLIAGRFFVGMSIGLAATIVPILISESAPTEIRGQLATLPQLLGSSGLFVAYCMVFGFSLMAQPSWRMILGVVLIPGALYLALCVCYLPESPRWLVSKGRMLEARHVLQNLRGPDQDVSAELALLVEGLGVGAQTQLEEWLMKPADKMDVPHTDEGQFTVFGPGGPEEDTAWVAQSIKEESGMTLLSRRPSMDGHSMPFVDDMVSLIGSLQNAVENQPQDFRDQIEARRNSFWGAGDEEQGTRTNGYLSEEFDQGMVGDLDENLQTPLLKAQSKTNLLSRQGSKNLSRGNSMRLSRKSSRIDGMFGEVGSVGGIGGGWQLAWRDREDGRLERVFLLQEGVDTSRYNSHMSLPGIGGEEAIQAAALIAPSVQFSSDLITKQAVGPAMVHPSETATKGPAWSDLTDIGVKRALVVGVGLQILQQFCGINAVLYFTPQILKQSGADAMAASVGINADSASILASAFTCLMMLPCIFLAMWLMDKSGRRHLLLSTLPILCVSLICVILVNSFLPPGFIQAVVSFIGVGTFICCFVMGFGPIPNIICSEIFPTRVRGIAIGITAAAMWISNVCVSYAFPIANAKFGLIGVFGFFATMTLVAWVFVFLKVPETKGLPLEIICEFFAMAGQQSERKPQTLSEESKEATKRV